MGISPSSAPVMLPSASNTYKLFLLVCRRTFSTSLNLRVPPTHRQGGLSGKFTLYIPLTVKDVSNMCQNLNMGTNRDGDQVSLSGCDNMAGMPYASLPQTR